MALPLKLGPGKFEQFKFDELKPNITNSTDSRVPIALTTTPITLASITLRPSKENVVWLMATIGYAVTVSINPPAQIVFRLWRGEPTDGDMIFSATENNIQLITTGTTCLTISSFTHVDDLNALSCQINPASITYYLTAEIADGTLGNIIGPITFVGSELITKN